MQSSFMQAGLLATASAPQQPSKPPLSPNGWSLPYLLAHGSRIKEIHRVAYDDPKLPQIIENFEENGIPVIIEYQSAPHWQHNLFTPEWLLDRSSQESKYSKPLLSCPDLILSTVAISVRNVLTRVDEKTTLSEFIQWVRKSTHNPLTECKTLFGDDFPH